MVTMGTSAIVSTPMGGAGAATVPMGGSFSCDGHTLQYHVFNASDPRIVEYISKTYNYSKIGNIVVVVGDHPDRPIFTFAMDVSVDLQICEIWNFKRHDSAIAYKGKTTACMIEILRKMDILDTYNIWLGVVEPKLIPGYERNGFRKLIGYEDTVYSPLGNTIGSPMISMVYDKLPMRIFPIKYLSNIYPSVKRIPIRFQLPMSITTDIVKHLYNETDSEKFFIFYTTSILGRSKRRSEISWHQTYFDLHDELDMFNKGRKIDMTSNPYKVPMYTEYVPRNSKYISGHSHPLSVYAAHSAADNFVLIQPPSSTDIALFIKNNSEVNFVFTLEGVYVVTVNLSAIPTVSQPEAINIISMYQDMYNKLFEHGKTSLQYFMRHFGLRYGADKAMFKSKLSALRAKDVTLFCEQVNRIKPDLFTVQFYIFNKIGVGDVYSLEPFVFHITDIGDKIHITEDEYTRYTNTIPDRMEHVDREIYNGVADSFKTYVSPLSNEDFANITSVDAELQSILGIVTGGGAVSGGGGSVAVPNLPRFVKGNTYELTDLELHDFSTRGYLFLPAGGAGKRGKLYTYAGGSNQGGGRRIARRHRKTKTKARKQHKRIRNTQKRANWSKVKCTK